MKEIIERLRNDEDYYGEFGRKYMSNSSIGTLLNNPILEPEKADETTSIGVASRNTKVYKEFLIQKDLSFVLLEKEVTEVDSLVKTMMGNFAFYEDIRAEGVEYEVPAIKEIKGMMWKGKADIVHPEMLIDLKTTANIQDFKRSANKFNYDSQAYIYQELFGKPLVFYVICKKTHTLGIFHPTDEFIKRGEQKVIDAIEVYNKFFSEDAPNDINEYYIEDTL